MKFKTAIGGPHALKRLSSGPKAIGQVSGFRQTANIGNVPGARSAKSVLMKSLLGGVSGADVMKSRHSSLYCPAAHEWICRLGRLTSLLTLHKRIVVSVEVEGSVDESLRVEHRSV